MKMVSIEYMYAKREAALEADRAWKESEEACGGLQKGC
jgi:hypothetical protein